MSFNKSRVTILLAIILALIAVGVMIYFGSALLDVDESPDPTETNPSTEVNSNTEQTEPEGTEPSEAPTEPDGTEPTVPDETEPVVEPTEPPEPTEPDKKPDEGDEKDDDKNTDKVPGNYKEVNETVYTTQKVNVRSGPGSSYEKLGSLKKGAKVTRTGIGDNGWSRIEFEGKVGYVYSDYLSKTKPSGDSGSSGGNSGGNSSGGTTTEGEIIYTYPDGTTGTVPMEGATYVDFRGVTVVYHEGDYESTLDDYYIDGVHYCEHCGKPSGDGTGGTCLRYLMADHDCPNCGEHVPADTCHYCDED